MARIGLVAHDDKKDDLVAWADTNRAVLARHELYGTGTTGGRVQAPEEFDGRALWDRSGVEPTMARTPIWRTLVLWLLLNESLALFDILFGAVLGLVLSRIMLVIDPEPPFIRRPLAAVRLFFVVAYDVIRSNFSMVAIIFNFSRRQPHSGFVNIPLQLRNRYGLQH